MNTKQKTQKATKKQDTNKSYEETDHNEERNQRQ